MSTELNLVTKLRENNINPSLPRIEILEYLYKNRIHPNIEEIYSALSPKMSSLSKATVYNTMELFEQKGIVKGLHIESNEIRYDIRTDRHGHLKCIECGAIYDIEVYDVKSELSTNNLKFAIITEEVNYRGICKNCIEKNNN